MKKVAKMPAKGAGMKLKQLEAENLPVEAGLTYWVFHALHWCALLACVVAFIYIGYAG